MTDLLERALITRIEVLEKEVVDARGEAEALQSQLALVAWEVFPNTNRAHAITGPDIVDELKRRGLANGKAGE